MTYDASVREAVENEGVAPSEYIALLPLDSESRYLLRLIFPEELESSDAIEAVTRIQQALALLELLQRAESAGGADEAAINIRFTIGFLDNLGIGALLIGSAGEIVGYNPSLQAQLGGTEPGDRLEDFLGVLIESGQAGAAETVLSYLSARTEDNGPDLRLRLRMPSGGRVELTVVRLSDDSEDSSACLVMVPRGEETGSEAPMVHVWREALQRVESTVEDLAGAAEQLQHRDPSVLGRGGKGLLARLDKGSRRLRDQLQEVGSSLRLAAETEGSISVDLGLLVDSLVGELAAAEPSRRITCEHAEIPAVCVPPAGMEQALRTILYHAVALSDAEEVRLSVDAEFEGDRYVLTVCDHGPGLAEDVVDELGRFFFRGPVEASEPEAGRALTLALAKQFLNQIGGDLSFDSSRGDGLRMLITIPREER